MINPADLRENIIEPVLEVLGVFNQKLNTEAAVELLLGTAAQETDLGYWLEQHPTGPGKSIYSIEPTTHKDIKRYLNRAGNVGLKEAVESLSIDGSDNDLIGNLYYSTAIARIKYWMRPEPLPSDRLGQAQYWDDYFNANNINQIDEYLDSYREFVE